MPKYRKLIDLHVSNGYIVDSTGNTYWTYQSDGVTNKVPSDMSSIFHNTRFAVNTKGEATYNANCLYTLTNDIVQNTKLGPIIKNYKLEMWYRLSDIHIGNILYFGYDPSNPSYRAFNIYAGAFSGDVYSIVLGSSYIGDTEILRDINVGRAGDGFYRLHGLIVSSDETKFELRVVYEDDEHNLEQLGIITQSGNFPLNLNHLINLGKPASYYLENGALFRVYSMVLSVPYEENYLKVY